MLKLFMLKIKLFKLQAAQQHVFYFKWSVRYSDRFFIDKHFDEMVNTKYLP